MDRLSQLPDIVLIKILTLLPTNQAARTIFLSKQWKNLWTHVFNIDLTDYNVNWIFVKTSLDRLLLPTSNSNGDSIMSHQIHMLKLNFTRGCHNYRSFMNKWLESAFSRGITELHIDSKPYLNPLYISSTFTAAARNLRILRLSNLYAIHWEETQFANFHLPHLTFLELTVTNPNQHTLNQLFCSNNFPALLTLHLNVHDFIVNHHNLVIRSPTLKELKLDIAGTMGLTHVMLRMDTPALQDFTLTDYKLYYMLFETMPKWELPSPNQFTGEEVERTIFLSPYNSNIMRRKEPCLQKVPTLCKTYEPYEMLYLINIIAHHVIYKTRMVVEFESICHLKEKYFQNKIGRELWKFDDGLKFTFDEI